MSKKPTVLMILDGYGLNEKTEGNAIAMAKTPVMDKLMSEYPCVKGNASGLAVGLPDGQMGNSEVGHMNMGAGRIIYQELTKITKAIEDGVFFENKALLAACENAKKNDSALHLMGLVSDGGVHSHIGHIFGLLELAKRQGLEKVYVHCFLDGRDTPPAETEKYAHVTFFFNGGVEEPNEGEDRILVKSPKVATYDLKPEMSAYEVCDKLVAAIKSDKYDVIVINFANPDMVGHTGVIEAAVKAIEAVDECVGKAYEALKEADGQMFICADHGNAEYMIDEETKEPFTAHTTNPVPFILVNADPAYKLKEDGCLADIAPTLIELMGMEQPAEMTGASLLVK